MKTISPLDVQNLPALPGQGDRDWTRVVRTGLLDEVQAHDVHRGDVVSYAGGFSTVLRIDAGRVVLHGCRTDGGEHPTGMTWVHRRNDLRVDPDHPDLNQPLPDVY